MIRIFLISVLLTGCVSDNKIYPGLFGQNTSGNETYVTVSNVWNEGDALPIAEKHCGQFGRSARFKDFRAHRATFDCVT